MASPLQLGVLISGRGSNLQAILDAVAADELAAEVRAVVSNKAKAAGLARARKAGVPTVVVDHRAFAERADFDAELVRVLGEAGAEWVVLAGFMRVLTPTFLRAFPHRVVNIHPALLPSFPGIDAQKQAVDYGVRITGCTVHLVDEGVDTGPVLAQCAVGVEQHETRAELADRLLEWEHYLLVRVLSWIAEGRLAILPPRQPDGRVRAELQGVSPFFGLVEAAGPPELGEADG